MSLYLVLYALAIAALSGVSGILFNRKSAWGQRIAIALMIISGIFGLAGSGLGLFQSDCTLNVVLWQAAGDIQLGIDHLSAFFLVLVFLIGGLGSLFGAGYWKQVNHQQNAKKLQLFWGFIVAGMGLVIISRHALIFLLGWEIMALAAFFLISTEDENEKCRKSALVYLISTHVGTLLLFALFVLWYRATGTFSLQPIAEGSLSPVIFNVLFFLAFFGFGLKAGLMPLHFWLPEAHANAPSHVSAILSGVMLKIGIYGFVRMYFLLPTPPVIWGVIILLFGLVSGLFGVVFAIAQHDLKRLLAYHSVENIGIILMGLGIAYLGRSLNKPEWIVLGMSGCLLHVWNHGVFKSLLFFGAGSVLHGTGSRRIDSLGGLAKVMPWTAFLFLIGSVAISGLPPLNGFISEFFIYMGLLKIMTDQVSVVIGAVFGIPILAVIGALAAACFVKVYSAVFLGMPRKQILRPVHESSFSIIFPMVILAVLCMVIGMMPGIISPVLQSITGEPLITGMISFKSLSWINIGIASAAVILIIFVMILRRKWKKTLTWDCGYVRPASSMQYTASSFADGIVKMFNWILRPHEKKPDIKSFFPLKTLMESHVNEIILDRLIIPVFRKIKRFFTGFNRFQQGQTQSYVFYIMIIVIILLLTLIPFQDWLSVLFMK